MVFGKLLKNKGRLIGVDIGPSGVKLAEIDRSGDRPRLVALATAPLATEVFQSNAIVKQEPVVEALQAAVESAGLSGARVVMAVPGPSVFIKRAKLPKVKINELDDHVRLEAANLIPHNIDAVKLDYHIIGVTERGEIELLVVAVKTEILESFQEVFAAAQLEPVIVDVEYFALQNGFEQCHAEWVGETNALIDIGHRCSIVNICRRGDSLFTGDISIGAKGVIDKLAGALSCKHDRAVQYLRGVAADQEAAQEPLSAAIDEMATEFNRQLTFFWNASGAEGGIDRLVLTGGGSQTVGLCEVLAERTGIHTVCLDPLAGIELSDAIDPESYKELAPRASVAIGLALREPGDKEIPEFEDD